MTEEVWKLKKQNAQLRKALAQAQAGLCQHEFNAADAEDKALGEAWADSIGLAEQKLKAV